MPAGEQLGFVAVLGQRLQRLIDGRGGQVLEGGRDHRPFSFASAVAVLAARMARQTVIGEAGMVTLVTPSGPRASTMALITAGAEPMAPDSPTPFVPSGFDGLGVVVDPCVQRGTLAGD